MPVLTRLRAHLRLRQRLRPSAAVNADEELAWWLREWDPAAGEDQRWERAHDAVAMVLRESGIKDTIFFDGKVVVDIGPGALGFPDACPARVSIGVDPLAQRFADAGLLLASDAIYLAARAEAIPLVSGSADVVLARNSLDHVDDPRAALAEARRLLRPGGTLILNFDVDHTPTPTEPHALDAHEVRSWLAPMEVVFADRWPHPHGRDGHAVVLVAVQP
ncbi:MAG: Methylase involved in ubiquinone/menaquinone biosynthesis [Conexibacter sp.]|nr:Methylase involved in ubiquinone/menaquinone biosynthesis [Conexibacter sp.]